MVIDREVIFELHRVGDLLKISAIDVVTGVEVSTFGPASYGADGLKNIATKKLLRKLEGTDDE